MVWITSVILEACEQLTRFNHVACFKIVNPKEDVKESNNLRALNFVSSTLPCLSVVCE